MKKILFVIQRYGKDMHGGAEVHCRDLAEALTSEFEVEVATTKAVDYTTWRNEFKTDREAINGVLVRRFKNDFERAKDHAHTEALLRSNTNDIQISKKWIVDQGPYSTPLFHFLKQNHENYYKIIFFQYLYPLTYFGMKQVPAKKIIYVPLVHDEPQVYYPLFRETFRKADWTVYNTQIEYEVAKKAHFVEEKQYVIAGMWANVPDIDINVEEFKKKNKLDKYVVYVGRVGPAKRVDILVKDFILYKKNNKNDLKLVLVGKQVKEMPKHPDVIELGFVSEHDKYAAMKGAIALVNPSAYESLSLIVLESFFMKRPILVNSYCDVLKDHCVQSNGGLWFETHLEMEEVMNYLYENPDKADQMGENGYKYARDNYKKDVVLEKWMEVLQ